MDLSGKNIAMVVANDGFRDPEAFKPKKVLENVGAKVSVVALEGGAAKGDEDGFLPVDYTVSQADINDFDAVAFIGGPGMAVLVKNQELVDLAKNFFEAGKLTCAICVAPAILAQADLIKGKKVSSWQGVEKEIEEAGGIYEGNRVSKDGLLITAGGPPVAKEFGEAIAKSLSS